MVAVQVATSVHSVSVFSSEEDLCIVQIKEVYSSTTMLHRESWQLEFTIKKE